MCWTVSFDQAAVWCDSWLLSDGNGMLQKILVEEIDDGSRQKNPTSTCDSIDDHCSTELCGEGDSNAVTYRRESIGM